MLDNSQNTFFFTVQPMKVDREPSVVGCKSMSYAIYSKECWHISVCEGSEEATKRPRLVNVKIFSNGWTKPGRRLQGHQS